MDRDADGMNTIQRARIRKTLWYFGRRGEFMAQLVREIANHERNASKHGLIPAVRLNGTSDIRWENVPVVRDGRTFANVFLAFPTLRFYDYTKIPNRENLPANYSLTFSAADGNDADVLGAIARGQNVAAVFMSRSVLDGAKSLNGAKILMRRMPMPLTHEGRPVIDGDKSDLRFLDPAGVIVGLRAKGDALTDTSGFVREVA
jgi:hypothetical protein